MNAHKRVAESRDTQFRRPSFGCYACHDTGLLVNGDGLINQFLSDYDVTPQGRRSGGHDLAIVCHCVASYPQYDGDGKIVRGGFREASGDVRKVQTERGLQPVGASLSKEITRELHSRRRQLWQDAEQQMTEAREAKESPWYVAETKAMLKGIEAAQGSTGGLQSLGSILGASPVPF